MSPLRLSGLKPALHGAATVTRRSTASAPEDHGLGQRLFYAVRGDGKVLAEGKFGAWTLGKGEVDVSLSGVKQLELETRVEFRDGRVQEIVLRDFTGKPGVELIESRAGRELRRERSE